MTLHVRPFASGDLAAVAAIEKQSFSDPWNWAMFASELQDRDYNFGRVAVDEENGDIAGYCFFWIVPGDEAQISNIAVHPQRRRQGIAQLLLEETIREGRLREATSVSLEVREANAPARAFYAKMGFIEVGRRPKYYKNPQEDALILRMKI
jgi:[ribosomal protein S18]-alanine N-acetyltransferase